MPRNKQSQLLTKNIFYGWWIVAAAFFTLGLAFLLLVASLPFLLFLKPPFIPYSFAVLFGLATGADFLLVALLAADHFGVTSLAQVLVILLPVMTVGQTWFPYLIALLREQSESYTLPLGVIFLIAVTGYLLLALLSKSEREPIL
jgi:hypothetical protein